MFMAKMLYFFNLLENGDFFWNSVESLEFF